MRSMAKLGVASIVLFLVAILAAQATRPADEPQERPPVKISDAARPLVDGLRTAYGNIKSLDLAGKVTYELDAADEKQSEVGEFTGSFQVPAKFRHDMKDDIFIASDEKTAYVSMTAKKRHTTVDAPKERMDLGELPHAIVSQLEQQNPALLLTIVKDAGTTLTGGSETADRGPDVTVDGVNYQALVLTSPSQTVTVLIDPKTNLLRRLSIDLKAMLVSRGMPKVNKAMMTIDYTKVVTDGPIDAAAFAWMPPADSLFVRLATPADASAEEINPDAVAMISKPAPTFTLKDLEDKSISLADQKGKVVVLDFWATWCVPCARSMPHLDKIYKELGPRGLNVYAINLRETKAQVEQFMKEQKLSMPALLDTDGKVADSYKVQPIPQTVVIGKDGTILKVMFGVGLLEGSEEEFRKTIEAALK